MLSSLTSAIEIRNQAASGNYLPYGDITEADCAIGQSFGFTRDKEGNITPGLANIALARFAIDNLSGMPKILQFEIADAYSQVSGQSNKPDFRIEKHRKKGAYLDTREVTLQAAEIMRENGWKTAVALGHPHHLPRIRSVMEAAGIETITLPNVIGVWDAVSEQKWTRSPEEWIKREQIAIGIYAVRGWLNLGRPQ